MRFAASVCCTSGARIPASKWKRRRKSERPRYTVNGALTALLARTRDDSILMSLLAGSTLIFACSFLFKLATKLILYFEII